MKKEKELKLNLSLTESEKDYLVQALHEFDFRGIPAVDSLRRKIFTAIKKHREQSTYLPGQSSFVFSEDGVPVNVS